MKIIISPAKNMKENEDVFDNVARETIGIIELEAESLHISAVIAVETVITAKPDVASGILMRIKYRAVGEVFKV